MRLLILAGLCACALAHPAAARLTELRMLTQEPFADGTAFGDAGPYVRIRATARGELDPADPANAGIALLDKAPRNAHGLVGYSTDVFILRPAEPARGSGVLLYDVTNRGNKFLMSWINDAPEPPSGSVNDPRSAGRRRQCLHLPPGLTRWCGPAGSPRPATANNGMAIQRARRDAKDAQPDRGAASGTSSSPAPAARRAMPRSSRLPYPVATMDTARLLVRSRERRRAGRRCAAGRVRLGSATAAPSSSCRSGTLADAAAHLRA